MIKMANRIDKIPILANFIFIFSLSLFTLPELYAEEVSNKSRCAGAAAGAQFAAQLESFEGDVYWKNQGSKQWQAAYIGDVFCYGDSLKTVKFRATLRLANNTMMRLSEGSLLQFIAPRKSIYIELIEGLAHFISRTPKHFIVKTPYMNASVDGTEFVVSANNDDPSVAVFEGVVTVSSQAGSVKVRSGEAARVEKGGAPQLVGRIRMQDSVDWALYFPPLFESKHLSKPLALALNQGDYKNALKIVAKTEGAISNPDLLATQTALALFYGQVSQAEKHIEQVFVLTSQHPAASSLRVLTTLVKGDKAQALIDALALDHKYPSSAVVKMALSYAQQGAFQLDRALASALDASQIAPKNALAHARVAELSLSVGDTAQALAAAKVALALSPMSSRAHSIRGFVALNNHKIGKALEYFNRAKKLDPADPLPSFALGLIEIRQGQLERGRQRIELAVALDPGNSLFRSYLGKAYFEERRNRVAGSQFDLAKQLDPEDPTPWFYQAILLRSENQPYQALQSMEESISLNDNRAVYRSRLLLDADEAARQSSQADIYLDLGFDELAKRMASKSLASAPGEYGGYRLLAESLVNKRGGDMARTSAILKAQLLQPLTSTPVPSILGEGDLLVTDGAGPSKLGINEFNTLFNSNDLHLSTLGLIGSNNTRATSTVFSGLLGPLSFSLSDYNYQTLGSGEGNDLEYDISSIFMQAQLSRSLSVIAEVASRDEVRGDLIEYTIEGVDGPTERTDGITERLRLGLHYKPRLQFELIGVVNYTEKEWMTNDIAPTPFFDVHTSTDAVEKISASEFQVLFNYNGANFVFGLVGSVTDRVQLRLTEFISAPFEIPPTEEPGAGSIRYDSFYGYATAEPKEGFQIVTGVSYAHYENPIDLKNSVSQWNLKLGVDFQVTDGLSIRSAAFRNIKRPLGIDQTLEPTQIAGFHQFYDDSEGSQSENYALGLDYEVMQNISIGLDSVYRELAYPTTSGDAPSEGVRLIRDRLYSTYGYWGIENWSASVQYFAERYGYLDGNLPNNQAVKMLTERVPLKVSYNHKKGISLSSTMSYVAQTSYFKLVSNVDTFSQEDDFWVLDLEAKIYFWRKQGAIIIEIKNAGEKSFIFKDTKFLDGTPEPLVYASARTVLARLSLRY